MAINEVIEMLERKLNGKSNLYILTTITTACAAAGLIISKYLLGSQPDSIEILVFAVIFWIIFFLVQSLASKRLGRK